MINTIDNNIPAFLLSPRFRIHRHVLLQLVILLITINIFWDTPDEVITTSDRFIAWLGYHLVICFLIYFNLYVLAPKLLLKNKLWLYLFSVLLTIWIGVFVIASLQDFVYDLDVTHQQINYNNALLGILSTTVSMGLLVAGTSAFLLFRYWISYNQRINELESTTLQSELKLLKDQINPHFLFNMLNNANVLIKKNRPEASEVLFKLEDLLRYQINDSSKENVLLSSEIHFLNDFLNLEKIRRDKFEYTIAKEGDISQVWLPPMLFIPFVENAVKHNSDSENIAYVNISFKVRNNTLEFCCENSKPAIPVKKSDVGGLGLKNIKRRLDLLFPQRHTLEINEDETTYTINLYLNL